MTAIFQLTSAGIDTENFSLYSNLDGFTIPFETNITKSALLAGFTSALVPDYTLIVRIKSNSNCVNFVDVTLESPLDCLLSDWTDWTVCENNLKSRTRTIVREASEGGNPCGPLLETEACGTIPKWVGIEPYCEQVEMTSFYFIGLYSNVDPAHPEGGIIKYINSSDVETQEVLFSEDGCTEIIAKSIVSNIGAITCTP